MKKVEFNTEEEVSNFIMESNKKLRDEATEKDSFILYQIKEVPEYINGKFYLTYDDFLIPFLTNQNIVEL